MRTQAPWLPYDPTWLVELAKSQKPRKKWLQKALAVCTLAQANTCCAPKICGYHFVDITNANKPGSAWQFKGNMLLHSDADGRFVVLDILEGNQVGGIEFV